MQTVTNAHKECNSPSAGVNGRILISFNSAELHPCIHQSPRRPVLTSPCFNFMFLNLVYLNLKWDKIIAMNGAKIITLHPQIVKLNMYM